MASAKEEAERPTLSKDQEIEVSKELGRMNLVIALAKDMITYDHTEEEWMDRLKKVGHTKIETFEEEAKTTLEEIKAMKMKITDPNKYWTDEKSQETIDNLGKDTIRHRAVDNAAREQIKNEEESNEYSTQKVKGFKGKKPAKRMQSVSRMASHRLPIREE